MLAGAGPSDAEIEAVSNAAGRTVPIAEALEPETFFQAAHSASGRDLVLAFAGEPSTSLRQQLEEAARPVHVEFRHVKHGWAKLRRLSDQVGRDADLWASHGADLSCWGPDWSSNKLRIGLVKYDPNVARSIEAHYGGDLVEVESQDVPLAQLLSSATAHTSGGSGFPDRRYPY
jgi:hypothetical protein